MRKVKEEQLVAELLAEVKKAAEAVTSTGDEERTKTEGARIEKRKGGK